MHIQHRTFQICLALCCALALLIGAWWFVPANQPSSPNQGIGLRAPAFMSVARAASDEATTAETDFLATEAGISAYMNTGSEIDLDSTEKFFRVIAKQTDDYIIGSVIPGGYEKLPEFEESMDIQVYIHREGWIVAYLMADQPASMVFDWLSYKSSGLTSTTLEKVVQRISSGTGNSGDIWYYDFRNQNATNLMLIADMEQGSQEWDNFTLEIPLNFVVSEASWSYAVDNGYSSKSTFQINDDKLSALGCNDCWGLQVAQYEFAPEVAYEIHIYHSSGGTGSASYGGIALIYREGQ